MADISQEINNFQNAVYGEEVRESMISLAEKVNADGENALSEVAEQVTRIDGIAEEATQTLNTANTAIDTANQAISEAQTTLTEATQQANNSASSAVLSQSWADGGTGTRPGEDSNNSYYYSLQSKTEADRAKAEADRAETYAGIVVPTLTPNFITGDLEYPDISTFVFTANYVLGELEYTY